MELTKQPIETTSDEQQITRFIEENYRNAVMSGEREQYMALFTEDVTYVPLNGPKCNDREAIGKFYDMFTGLFNLSTRLEVHELEVFESGVDAYAHGSSMATLTPKDGSETISPHFRLLWLLKKTPHGWRIRKQSWNEEPKS